MADQPIHSKAQKRPKATKRPKGQTESDKASTCKADTGKIKLKKTFYPLIKDLEMKNIR
jgi:hypothetical protein